MADQIQTPGSGGGEGVQAVVPSSEQPALEAKSVELPKAVVPAEVKTEEVKIVKPEETLKEVQPEPPIEVKPEELKPEQPAVEQTEEVKQEVASVSENKVEAPLAESKETGEVKTKPNGTLDNIVQELGDWQQKESELLKTIEDLEKVKKERTKESLVLELKVRQEEIDLLKARVKNLETELQAALSKPSGKNHEMIENIKQQHEELLSKARGMIFDKTKMVKNQELQIEALNTQIQSLKDINQITKDLLEIRNSEIKAMEDRLQAMEARFKAEKERYGLVLQRAQTSSNINDDLRKEYETQLVLFKQLREKYDQRVQALVAENERLKGAAPGGGAGTSG